MLERERDSKKKRKNRKISQEDQISVLTFNFHGALSISNFLNELTVFTKKKGKRKKKKKREKRKIEVKRGERRERKKREKLFV